jgi:hypothetical protein
MFLFYSYFLLGGEGEVSYEAVNTVLHCVSASTQIYYWGAGRLRIGQSASRTAVNGEMSLRRLKLSTYEVIMPREDERVQDDFIIIITGNDIFYQQMNTNINLI